MVHRASHRSGMLWRMHSVHHSVKRMYGLNGLLKHPLHQTLETLTGTAPPFLLGMPGDVAWLLGFAVSIELLLQHSNIDMRPGRLTALWAIAQVHRFHHLANGTEGNVNFGLFTTLWDRLLGTSKSTGEDVRDGTIGIEGQPDFPRGYVPQLLEPFRTAR